MVVTATVVVEAPVATGRSLSSVPRPVSPAARRVVVTAATAATTDSAPTVSPAGSVATVALGRKPFRQSAGQTQNGADNSRQRRRRWRRRSCWCRGRRQRRRGRQRWQRRQLCGRHRPGGAARRHRRAPGRHPGDLGWTVRTTPLEIGAAVLGPTTLCRGARLSAKCRSVRVGQHDAIVHREGFEPRVPDDHRQRWPQLFAATRIRDEIDPRFVHTECDDPPGRVRTTTRISYQREGKCFTNVGKVGYGQPPPCRRRPARKPCAAHLGPDRRRPLVLDTALRIAVGTASAR